MWDSTSGSDCTSKSNEGNSYRHALYLFSFMWYDEFCVYVTAIENVEILRFRIGQTFNKFGKRWEQFRIHDKRQSCLQMQAVYFEYLLSKGN